MGSFNVRYDLIAGQLAISVKVKRHPRRDRLHSFRIDVPDHRDNRIRLIRRLHRICLRGQKFRYCSLCAPQRQMLLQHRLNRLQLRIVHHRQSGLLATKNTHHCAK